MHILSCFSSYISSGNIKYAGDVLRTGENENNENQTCVELLVTGKRFI